VLTSYVRPKIFYRLCIARCPNITDYILVEQWFLSSSFEYDGDTSPRAPFSDKKLSHPAFFFRLQPFRLALNICRTTIFIQTSQLRLRLHPGSHWFPPSLRSNNPQLIRDLPPPWKTSASAIPKITHLLPFPTIKINKKGSPDKFGRFLLITSVPHSSPPLIELKSNIQGKLLSQPLPLSRAQSLIFQAHNTNALALFKTIHLLKLRPAIQSFMWRLLHKTLHLHMYDSCPLCSCHPLTSQHLFSTCPIISAIRQSPCALTTLLSPPHDKTKTLHTTITLWAIWKLFNREIHHGPIPNDARIKVLQTITSDELSRVKLAHPLCYFT